MKPHRAGTQTLILLQVLEALNVIAKQRSSKPFYDTSFIAISGAKPERALG